MDNRDRSPVKLSKIYRLTKQCFHAVWNYIFQRNLMTILVCIYCITALMLISSHSKVVKRLYQNSKHINYVSRSLRALHVAYDEEQQEEIAKLHEMPNMANFNANTLKKDSLANNNEKQAGQLQGNGVYNGPVNDGTNGQPRGKVPHFKENEAQTPLDKRKGIETPPVDDQDNNPAVIDKPKEIVVPLETVKAGHQFAGVEPREQIWQNVTADGTMLLFSAGVFRAGNGQLLVRALAMNGNNFFPKVLCVLIYDNNNNVTVRAKVWMLPDHHEKNYKTVFLMCPLPEDKVPTTLSVVEQTDTILRNAVPVIYHEQETRQFTVCLSPMFYNTSVEHELVQWIELNKILGADMFYVYNFSTVGRTDEILNHYVKEGIVKVIQWHIPPYTDIHYYGQTAMLNDCLFRNIKVSRYMVNMDLDEFIVPRQALTTWTALMPTLPAQFCEYSFRSSLVVTDSKDVYPGKQVAREFHISALLRNSRREYIFDRNVRTKYIVNTTCIDTVGIHYCWRYKHGTEVTQRYHVVPRAALMLHFRREAVAKKGKEVPEMAIYKYHEELIANVKARWEKIDSEKKV